ncbi:hypothetical protein HRUBRA_01053 [Pseudohaliea rubra DSM 19751]|uniref:Uncharacterized protein n=1 Tax=Pseudohaliea rubra DSM 19751 TaxID=1265313 RepID=A0A095VSD1_9GAMM|nr:hypothetical protein HRUBRA_01053 [Pseudohaliea rubra DSM 19751]
MALCAYAAIVCWADAMHEAMYALNVFAVFADKVTDTRQIIKD